MGAAYGTAKSGTGIAAMAVMRPEAIMKSIIPVVMAGRVGRICNVCESYSLNIVRYYRHLRSGCGSSHRRSADEHGIHFIPVSVNSLNILWITSISPGALFTWVPGCQSGCLVWPQATLSEWWVTPGCGARPSSPGSSSAWSWFSSSPRSWDFTGSSWQSIFTPRNKKRKNKMIEF